MRQDEIEYNVQKKRLYLILFALFCAGLGLWAGVSVFLLPSAELKKALASLANIGLVLAFGSVLGGLVTLVFGALGKLRDDRLARHEFIRNILADLKSVFDMLETARILIDAHQSAKTYGEQMRLLPEAIMKLRNILRALRPGFRDLEEELSVPLTHCITFLEKLLEEYKSSYKEVSRLQSIDERIETDLRVSIASAATRDLGSGSRDELERQREQLKQREEPDQNGNWPPARYLSNAAWSRISNDSKGFARLRVLRGLDESNAYQTEFIDWLDLASYVLRARLPGGKIEKPTDALESKRLAAVEAFRARTRAE